MASQFLNFFGYRKRKNNENCGDEEMSLSTPLKERRDGSSVENEHSPDERSSPNAVTDQWAETAIPPLIIPPEMWQSGSPSAKLLRAIVQQKEGIFKSELSKLSLTAIKNIDVSGESLLHIVCHKKNESLLNMIMEYEIFLCPVNSFGMTPLHLAVHLNWLPGVQALLLFGANPDILPEYICEDKGFARETPILTAARNGNKDILEALLAKIKTNNAHSRGHNNIFHLISYSQKFSAMEFLIQMKDKFTDINELNKDDESPLHTLFKKKIRLSSDGEIVEIVLLLLQNQVPINKRNNNGESALHLAAKSGLPNVVSALIQHGADAAIKTKSGENILHAACRSSEPNVLKNLLEMTNSAHLIKEHDTSGIIPFHIAARNSSVECCLLLLQYGDHLTNTDSDGLSRFSFAMRNMSNGEDFVRKLLNSNISQTKNENEMSSGITIDFSSIMSHTGSNDIQDTIVSEFSYNTSEELIVHPVIESFLYLKWKKIRPFYYFHLIMFILFLILHTYYIVYMYCIHDIDEVDTSIPMFTVVYNLHMILLAFLFLVTTAYVLVHFKRYYKHFETYFNIGSLTLSMIVVFSKELKMTESYMRRDVAAISVFFCWTEFMMLLGRDPAMNGTYVLMFTKIAKSLIKFLTAFLVLLIAFTFCFSVLFHDTPFFKEIPTAFVKVLVMMTGEIEYSDFFCFLEDKPLATRIISNIFLVIFIFLITILLASLLISLAVNDLPDLHRQGNIRKLVKQASYLLSYEKIAKAITYCQNSKKFNVMKVIMQICNIQNNITIDMHDKSPIIPRIIINTAMQICVDNPEIKMDRQLKYGEFLDALSSLKTAHANDIKMIEEKLDKVIEIVAKVTQGKRGYLL